MVSVRVCMNTSCAKNGSNAVIRDIEDLCHGQATVEDWGCLGKCEIGPNVEIAKDGSVDIVSKLRTYKAVSDLVTGKLGIDVPETTGKVGQLKFNIRREEDETSKMDQLAKAFGSLGGVKEAEKAHPHLTGQLLLIRSQMYLRDALGSAIRDAEKATKLLPASAFAFETFADALAAGSRAEDAVKAQKKALDIGGGINPGSAKRTLKKYERKVATEAEDPEGTKQSRAAAAKKLAAPMVMVSNEPEPAAPAAKATAKGKAKAKGKGKAAARKSPSNVNDSAEPGTRQNIYLSCRPPSSFSDWQVVAVSKLNYNTIRLVMMSKDKETTSAHPFPVKDVWHVDILKESDDITRAYTPVSDAEGYSKGMLDFMIKIYPDGRMTSWLATLKLGNTIPISEPCPTADPSMLSGGLFMVAGGSAVTVAMQLMKAVLARFEEVSAYLVLCNTNYADIVFADTLANIQEQYPNFHVTHCVSIGPLPENLVTGRSKYKIGRLSVEDLKSVDPQMLGCVSGPPGLCRAASKVWKASGRTAGTFTFLDSVPDEKSDVPFSTHSCRRCLGLGRTLLDTYCICAKGKQMEGEGQSAALLAEADIMLAAVRTASLKRAEEEIANQKRMENMRAAEQLQKESQNKVAKVPPQISFPWSLCVAQI
eukprot:TRINITY_DN45938_c0_g1_i1.p1 TRINITY_DN45938_c0_g1~~TRINITY_DN45938_c0_g1_i1.p1  ORF type:complete len:649 (-),score=122.10 TRINITY_DN45938_c0_g1_i1:43-1989(-)